MANGGLSFVDIGNRIRVLREALGFKNAALFAAHVGWSPQQLSNYENGHKRPELSMAIKLCVRTGADLDYIYRGESSGLPMHVANAIQDYLERQQNSASQA